MASMHEKRKKTALASWRTSRNRIYFGDGERSRSWMKQFPSPDQSAVQKWLNCLKIVDAETFRNKMLTFLEEVRMAHCNAEPVAIYAERELRKLNGKPQYAFHEKITQRNKIVHRRAYGKAAKLKPIQSSKTVGPEIGSEGIITNLLTQLQRGNSTAWVFNAGPDRFRQIGHQIHHALIVCDFIGTGDRAKSFLDSFWRVATVRSWISRHLLKFHVVAFSGTQDGIAAVRQHVSQPLVHWIAPCPTLDTEFSEDDASVLKDIFIRNDPIDHDPTDSLGYGGLGCMLVFAHGCPNNTPRVLFKRGRKWRPLFPERGNTLDEFFENDEHGRRTGRLARLTNKSNEKRLAEAPISEDGLSKLLVMCALKAGHHFEDEIARATALELRTVKTTIRELRSLGWITDRDRLTENGRRNLANAEPIKLRYSQKKGVLTDERVYYPKSLRPPK